MNEMTAKEINEAEIQMIEDPELDDRMNKMDQENKMKELETIYNNYGIAECDRPKTLNELLLFYESMDAEYDYIDKDFMRLGYAHRQNEIRATAMDVLLDMHGVTYDPNSLHDEKRNDKNRWFAEGSLYERNVVIRESLRKTDDGLAFVIVKHEINHPSDRQEHIITKEDVVYWLWAARASDDLIFEITGEIPNYPNEDELRL